MYKSFIKILSILLIIGLNWVGFSVLIDTFAYLNDLETSSENSFSAGTLNFDLSSSEDFFPPSPNESNQLIRNIILINEGNLDFKYQIRVSTSSGPLCKNLKLEAKLDGRSTCPIQDLENFSCGPFEISDNTDNWLFTASLPEGFSLKFFPQSCKFILTFDARQPEFESPSTGFSDSEEIENTIEKHFNDIFPSPDIVINEFLPDPVGDDSAPAPNGEWVELYNRGNSTTTLDGWFLMDFNGKILSIPTSILEPGKFFVVYLNGTYSPGWLNNASKDGVFLVAPKGTTSSKLCLGGYCIVDFHFYTGNEVIEGKSFARIPDGSKNWYDPEPTPGLPNKLSEEEIKNGLEPMTDPVLSPDFLNQFLSQLIFNKNEELTPSNEEISTSSEATSSETTTNSTSSQEIFITTDEIATMNEITTIADKDPTDSKTDSLSERDTGVNDGRGEKGRISVPKFLSSKSF